jgi:hypothetical protein
VARACDFDYVEPKSLRRDDMRALCLWAWTYDPADIPKLTWLTITGNTVQVHDSVVPPRGRRGLTFRVIVHLDLVEAPPDEHGRTATKKHTWLYGVVDGERVPGVRRDPPPAVGNGTRRGNDVDDDDHRGRRGRSSGGWGSTHFRSIP